MAQCHNGMIKKHSGAAKAHDFADFFSHLRFIAVYPAIGAESFCFHKRTSVAAGTRIFRKFPAFRAEFSCQTSTFFPADLRMVLLFTVKCDHFRNQLFFAPALAFCITHQLILPFSTE